MATHPLKDTWKLIALETVNKEVLAKHNGDYTAAQRELMKTVETITTVEELWSAFNVLPPLQNLPTTDNLALFRISRVPEFEAFPGGGRVVICGLPSNADKLAERLAIAVVGEQVSHAVPSVPESVCGGLRIGRRAKKGAEDNVRVEVWISTHSKDIENALDTYFKQILADDNQGAITLQWEAFSGK